uniref:Large ribosomal subunit protein uL23c n=1 Tax=Chondria sp. (in: red algae) TaxID=1982705 RepID=A0A1Z1MCW1_9FLOR|nr:ribosomal protein L23 [Chondria sp. (in: red algae)]
MIQEKNTKSRTDISIIKYPIITDKTTKNIENNIYYFQVNIRSKKNEIKTAIEEIFNVKVAKVNTSISAPKSKTIGKFKGKLKRYKKAIVKLKDTYTINLFDSN